MGFCFCLCIYTQSQISLLWFLLSCILGLIPGYHGIEGTVASDWHLQSINGWIGITTKGYIAQLVKDRICIHKTTGSNLIPVRYLCLSLSMVLTYINNICLSSFQVYKLD